MNKHTDPKPIALVNLAACVIVAYAPVDGVCNIDKVSKIAGRKSKELESFTDRGNSADNAIWAHHRVTEWANILTQAYTD